MQDIAHAEKQLFAAAQLSPRLRRVRLSGFHEQLAQITSVLLVLPTSLWELHLDVRCPQRLPMALQRFSALQSLRITGNGSSVDWSGCGAPLPKLAELRLDFRRELMIDPEDAEQPGAIHELSISTALHLHSATGLHSLELRAKYSEGVRALLGGLPALRRLRLDIYECENEHAQAAVTALSQLPAHVHYAFGVHAYRGHEENYNYPDVEEYPWLSLPPMAHLRGLTELCLVGLASLPLDWRQLPSLQRLTLANDSRWAEEGNWDVIEFEWGTGPLTAMTALSRLDILGKGDIDDPPIHGALPDAAELATAPALARVHADRAPTGWLAQLRALRPYLELTS
ncbi:hypothetical protein ABPG75_012791 [Micractinium tetrahymenae]